METQMGKTDGTVTLTPGTASAGKVNVGEYEAPIDKATLDGLPSRERWEATK